MAIRKNFNLKMLCRNSMVYVLSLMVFTPAFAEGKSRSEVLLNEICGDIPHDDSYVKRIYDEINMRIRVARERNYSREVKSGYGIVQESSSQDEVFRKIYDSNFWESSESRSGPGSQIDSTERIREALPKIFSDYNIKSVLDTPCGDYNWMKLVDKSGISYVGGDIVPEIVENNNKKFGSDSVSFRVLDITKDDLPKSDLVICRDCLQHFSIENVKKALYNFKRSGSKYLLVTNYSLTLDNYDIKDGDFRPLNLCQKPFYMSEYVDRVRETGCRGNLIDKYLYLYDLEKVDIDKVMEPVVLPSNIPIAMALNENYLYPTVVSITSAMENSNSSIDYDFYIMHTPNFSDKSKNILTSLANKYSNCHINLIDMGDKYTFAHTTSLPTSAYYRLMLSDLLPDLNKIIWIDGDTIVFDDLVDMIGVDMSGYCYKGLLDYSDIDFAGILRDQLGVNIECYICSGVMVLNLEELRKENAVSRVDDFIFKHNDKLVQHDQTVINAVFADKIGALPARFGIWDWYLSKKSNVESLPNLFRCDDRYTAGEMLSAIMRPSVLHCISKPWYVKPGVVSDIWWKYAEKTDVFKEIQEKYLINDGTYKLVSALDSNKLLDISGASKDDEAKLQIWNDNGTDAQRFKIKYDKNGYFTIQSLCSGKMIDVPGSTIEAGKQLWQYTDNDTDAQKWRIIRGDGGCCEITSKCNNLFMDVSNFNTENGTPIKCWYRNYTNAQKFRLVRVD